MAAEPPVATNKSKGNESPSRSEAIRVAPPRYGWGGSNCPDSSAQEGSGIIITAPIHTIEGRCGALILSGLKFFVELCGVNEGVDEGVNKGECSENKTEIEEEGEDSENEIEGSEEVEGSENEELSQTEGIGSGDSQSLDEKKSGEKSDETGDELSNYISDDHSESKNESDSDFEDDPLQGSLNRDASVLADGKEKIKLEKGMFVVFSYDKPWTIMSDRQKGLVETINEIVPNVVNRRCARHIYDNFREQFAGAALKRYFWQAARSYNVAGFNFELHKIKELKPAAYDWLLKIPADMWSRHAFDERLKNDHVTNNISESFNHWVGDLRSKPVLTLVDGLRTKLMCRLQKRKLKGLKMSGILCQML
ncbi:UNVERIFIED_CONTAM: hypothetical protein Scaly_1805600 [Sesamum calycinum]|uniref:Uncharacterized protein n=1 Tax=Sesamum calycinum TaxID=2727403 RepID=A0AAW2NCD0_9LAMI